MSPVTAAREVTQWKTSFPGALHRQEPPMKGPPVVTFPSVPIANAGEVLC